MRVIKSVSLEFPNDDEGMNISYVVGQRGVTSIIRNQRNGEMAKVDYFEIYAGEDILAELHHYSHITYGEVSNDQKR